MPSKYPVLPAKVVLKVLERHNFWVVSQRGSHKKLTDGTHTVIVPMHDEIAKGTLKSIIEQSGLTLDNFL